MPNTISLTDKNLCGIDEAGRGPLAGSLVVAGVVLHKDIDGLNDSKKLSQKKREELYPLIIENSTYHIVSFSAKDIDEKGISKCIKEALIEIKNHIEAQVYLFDGNSPFGVDNIDTMVKADTKVSQVASASILAKITHDNKMIELSKTYPQYGFEKHKGYGTKAHIKAILKYGRTPIHRHSFRVKGLE